MKMPVKSATGRFAAGALLIAAVSSFAVICSAADTAVTQTLVKYGDLDVSSAAGATALYARIHAAAKQVCRSFDGRDLTIQKFKEACIHNAIADAVIKVDQPALFSVYNAKTGASKPIMLVAR